MNVRYPKTVIIGAIEFGLKFDSSTDNGNVDLNDKTINIGCSWGKHSLATLAIFYHEVLETILYTSGWRYQNYRGTFTFSLDHDDLVSVVDQFTTATKDIRITNRRS